MDLVNELFSLQRQLIASIGQLKKNGSAFAEAERDYKVALNKTVLKLRSDGMAATLIALVVYGEKEVAEYRFKRDVAKTIYETNQEHINATKLNIRIIESQISREWGNSK
ncbi:hypothetical protein D0T49_04425 [Paludibacter sp. 221]|uniref:hypothetical protein n=1 Tax=Paludibacter sp. 221 TaxID=2302939 RepID=UPI0013D55EC0|nr:hypothetical protein [Paludibacter sp. 221]NDV46283.1 hypothetical protein [Paludibacter sp. 221]